MEFGEALKIYLEVGLLGLCAIMMIVTYYKNNNRNNDRQDNQDKTIIDSNKRMEDKLNQLMDNIQQQNNIYQENQEKHFKDEKERTQQLIDKIVNGVSTHVPSSEENQKITQVSNEINNILQDILQETNASRANLVQYHNGGKGINKQSFLKMSITNEQVQVNVRPFMQDFKDQFRSTLAYFVNELDRTGFCFITNLEEIKTVDTSMYEFLKLRNIEAKCGMAIHNRQGTVIAFVCIEFMDKNDVDLVKIKESFNKHKEAFETLLNL